jgi:pyruvate dehydrogenase E1 component alpha subunit/2-oxoisovalerate dehydrogenase E1 component alpha subunit
MLMARRLQGRLGDAVGAACIGEGATSTGSFHEALNMAAVEKLPLILAVANNQFAYSTPNNRQFACANLVDRAIGYGVEGYKVDGTDLEASLKVFQTAVSRARAGHGPQLVVGNLLRLSGHGEHDDASYVPAAMKKGPLSADCLLKAEQVVLDRQWMSTEDINQHRENCVREVDKAFAQTAHEPPPDPFRETWHALSTPWLAESWEAD